MKRGLDWYKRDPRAMIDAKRAANEGLGMTVRQAAVYDLITDLIYEGAGETPNNPQHVASHFKDMGSRAARETIEQLISMGKLVNMGGMLVNKRASDQAQSRVDLSEIRAENGRAGGVQSGKTRRKLSGNSSETQRKLSGNSAETQRNVGENDEFSEVDTNENSHLDEALASSKRQAEKEKSKSKIGGGGSAQAREKDFEPPPDEPLKRSDAATYREKLLLAMGCDASGLTGRGGVWIGSMGDMAEADRWENDLGLGRDQIVTVIGEVMRSKPDGPPSKFKYFTPAMQRAAGDLKKPPLEPTHQMNGASYGSISRTDPTLDAIALAARMRRSPGANSGGG